MDRGVVEVKLEVLFQPGGGGVRIMLLSRWFPQRSPVNLNQEVEELVTRQRPSSRLRSSEYFGHKNRPWLPSERHFLSSGGQK